MALDLSPLLRKVAEMADDLEKEYGRDVEVGEALIIIELLEGDGKGGIDAISIEHRCTTPSMATALGLAEAASRSLTEPWERGDDEEGQDAA